MQFYLFFLNVNLKNICTDKQIFVPECRLGNYFRSVIYFFGSLSQCFLIIQRIYADVLSCRVIAKIILCEFPNLKTAFGQTFQK